MHIKEFREYVLSMRPDKHFVGGRRGSEENIKIKFVVPLFQYLGYDLREDFDFEFLNLDILLRAGEKSVMVVESKAWDAVLTDHLNQCLEYCLKSRIPYILITSGQSSALYSSLLNFSDLNATKPIIQFGYKDLINKKGEKILGILYHLISKQSFLDGSRQLRKIIEARLPKAKTLDIAMQEFSRACSGFTPDLKIKRINEEDFERSAKRHPRPVYEALMFLRIEIEKIARQNENMRIRYRSKEIGLEYLYNAQPRQKILGLFGIYPEKTHVAFGIESWKKLGTSSKNLEKMENPKKMSRSVTTVKQAAKIIKLLRGVTDDIFRKHKL